MMRISDFCLVFAAVAALCGMALGIIMGISQDFTLAPAHAHLNLLGWVTMALYGLYHRGAGRTGGFAGWMQVGSGALGAALMAGGLGVYLFEGHDDRFVPLVIAGSLLAVLGMLMFLGLVVVDLKQARRRSVFGLGAHSG
jgi:ABC-type proline/glycine betaine transport system permease subunit